MRISAMAGALWLAGSGLAGLAAQLPVGLGQVLTTRDGGQIFGFDIHQAGDDGVLASAQTIDGKGDVRVSMQVFDQNSGAITRSFAKYTGLRNEYAVDGIAAGDVALVTHYVTPKGTIYPRRVYAQMNPVSAGKFTVGWTAPVRDIDIVQLAENQASSTSVAFAIELKRQDAPILVVSDIAANTVSRVIPIRYSLENGLRLGQYVAGNQAILAASPDGGRVGGAAPVNVIVDLQTGASRQFNGFNNGGFHAGYVNGLAVDPSSGIAATTTELNSQVEFYDMKRQKGIVAVQLPCTTDTDQSNSGSGIAVDPLHHWFLVTDTDYCDGSQGSAIVVYDAAGNYIETISGFQFFIGEPAPVLNPAKRMGWAFGGPKGVSQLQQFFY